MFKVECPSCSASYQVDERRVPAAGLKMRCPKCASSFRVRKPGDAGPEAVLEDGTRPRARKSPDPKGTMIGVAAVSGSSAPPPSQAKRKFAGTMIGVAAPTGSRSSHVAVPRPDRGSRAEPPPAPRRPAPSPARSAPARKEDLPALAPRVANAPPPLRRERSTPREPKQTPAAVRDLPAPRQAKPAPRPEPTERTKGEVDSIAPTLEFEVDRSLRDDRDSLPAVREPRVQLQPSISKRPTTPATGPVRGDSRDSLELPSPVKELGSAGVLGELELDASFGELDLPAVFDAKETPAEARDDRDSLDFSQQGLPSLPPELPSKAPGATPSSPSGEFNPFDGSLELPELNASDAELFESLSADPSSSDLSGSDLSSLVSSSPDLLDLPSSSSGPSGWESSDTEAAEPPGFGELDFGDELALEAPRSAESSLPADDRSLPTATSSVNDFDPFDESLGAELSLGTDAKPAEPGRAGASYGEVELPSSDTESQDSLSSESSGLDTDDGMEFGGIPQEPSDGEETAAASVPASSPSDLAAAPASKAAGAKPVVVMPSPAPSASRKKRRWPLVGFAVLLTLGIAGGALALVPDVGPFGVHWISDWMNRPAHEASLRAARGQWERHRQVDTFPESERALEGLSTVSRAAPRYRPLSAYLAFAQYAHVLRFGPQPEVRSRAKVLMDELRAAEVPNSLFEMQLARAAQAAVEGNAQPARSALERLRRQRPESLAVLSTLAELELAERHWDRAKTLWLEAVRVQPTAWTKYGLARTQLALDQLEPAEQLAKQVLQSSPGHIGARLLLAERHWAAGDEDAARTSLTEVLADAQASSQQERLLAHTITAEIHLGRGRLSKAETEFEHALQLDPKDYRALVGLGDAFLEAGRYAAGLARYEAAATAFAEGLRAQVGIAKAHLFLERTMDAASMLDKLRTQHPKDAVVAYWAGRADLASGQRDRARAAYRAAIESGQGEPEVALSYVALAQLLTQENEAEAAAELLAEAQGNLPDSALLRKALGNVALSQGRYEDALDAFRAASRLEPNDIGAKFSIGSSLRRLGQYEEALATFAEVAQVDKDLPGLALERGLLLEQSGKSDEALKEYEDALAKAPQDPDLMLRVGCGRVVAGDGKAAQQILEKVLQLRPRSAETHHCLGRAFFLQDKLLEALQSLQRAVDADPNRAEYHLYVGWVANAAGQMALAERSIETALAKDQRMGDAYWQRGVLLLRQGAALDAIRSFERALELRPSRYEVHADLAQAYYQVGQEQKALAEWKKAIEHEPNNATWLFRYGKLLNAKRDHREALPRLQKAIELVEGKEPRPPWLWQAHHLTAVSLGYTPRALPHWRKFLELGPEDSPYREDAKRALARAGQAWSGR